MAPFFGKGEFNAPFPLPAQRIWDRPIRILLKKSCAISLRDEKVTLRRSHGSTAWSASF